MTVCSHFALLFLIGSHFAIGNKMPSLRVVDRNAEYIRTHKNQKSRKAEGLGIGNDFLKTYYKDAAYDHEEPPEEHPFKKINFETEEIHETVEFIEFRMEEFNALIQECITHEFAKDQLAPIEQVRFECIGERYQILVMNYKEAMKRVKDVLSELIKIKISITSPQDFSEEIAFLIDLIEQMVDSDFRVKDSLDIAMNAGKYYVSPEILKKIVRQAEPELLAFGHLHERLRESRNEIKRNLEEHEVEEEYQRRKLIEKRNANSLQLRRAKLAQRRPRKMTDEQGPETGKVN